MHWLSCSCVPHHLLGEAEAARRVYQTAQVPLSNTQHARCRFSTAFRSRAASCIMLVLCRHAAHHGRLTHESHGAGLLSRCALLSADGLTHAQMPPLQPRRVYQSLPEQGICRCYPNLLLVLFVGADVWLPVIQPCVLLAIWLEQVKLQLCGPHPRALAVRNL